MKVLGLSFGRDLKNCDILTKTALMAAQSAGAEVKFMNVMKKDIGHCTGCGACSAGRDKGKQIRCIIKDDYLEIENEVLEADGIILAAPVYSVGLTGQLKNYIDRFGAAHDRAFCLAEQEKRQALGDVELLDERLFRNKYVAYISVGGASTQNWVSLGIPTMYLFGMSSLMKPVGQMDAYDMGRTANPLLDDQLVEKASSLGRHLAENIGKAYDEVEWWGDEGVCPVCHNKFINIMDGSTRVECPICGIEGDVSIENNQISVVFSKEQQARARGTLAGMREHYLEIQGMKDVAIPKIIGNKEKLETLMVPYKEFQSTY